jgi:hypothetical protein
MIKTIDFSASTQPGEKTWGPVLPQANHRKSFACLAWADKLLSHPLPLFLGSIEAARRWSGWERSALGARQAPDMSKEVRFS